MITKEELRVGNAIQYDGDGTNAVVKSIEEYGIGVEFKEEETWIEYDQFSGIPLTEEIIIKVGYKLENPNASSFGKIGYPQLYQEKNSFSMPYGIPIIYLHQLQNRIFSLTGKELIFEL